MLVLIEPVTSLVDENVRRLDESFLKLLIDVSDNVCKTVEDGTITIMQLSESVLRKDVSDILERFKDLYFSKDHDLDTKKNDINTEVDDIFEAAQAMLDSTGNVELDDLEEDEEKKTRRLGLSSVQKELESIASVEEGIREQVVSILTGMQFSDAMYQRITHIRDMWIRMSAFEHAVDGDTLDAVNEFNLGKVTSVLEVKQYYNEVLGKDPPKEEMSDELTFFSF